MIYEGNQFTQQKQDNSTGDKRNEVKNDVLMFGFFSNKI